MSRAKRCRPKAPLFAWLAGLAVFPGVAAAQIVTDGTLGAAGSITPIGNLFNISQSLGQTAGNNLFQSFSQFDVPTGTEARFTGVATLENIIARVTGGDISDIDGLVSVVGPTETNLFLINPAGIAITGGAQFDIPGGLYLSSINDGWLSSDAEDDENAGILIAADRVALSADSFISSDVYGSADSGGVSIHAQELTVLGWISADVWEDGSGASGGVRIQASRARIESGGLITADTLGFADAGPVTLIIRELTLDGGQVTADALDFGGAGLIEIVAEELVLINESTISASADIFGTGTGRINIDAGRIDVTGASAILAESGSISVRSHLMSLSQGAMIDASSNEILGAGSIGIEADLLLLDDASIAAEAFIDGAGALDITAGSIELRNGSVLSVESELLDEASALRITTSDLTIDASRISSESLFGVGGSIVVVANSITLSNGASITSDTLLGFAGSIFVVLPSDGTLSLLGGLITTSSGLDSGGSITIYNPVAIISDGGSILALGEVAGANVNITSGYFIQSADAVNLLSVDGTLVLDSSAQDVSQGAETTDISFLDASRVLRGQCPAVQARGETSQLSSNTMGPYSEGFQADDARTAGLHRAMQCRR